MRVPPSPYWKPDWFRTRSIITAALNFQPAPVDYVRRTATCIEYPRICQCLIAGISHDCVVSSRDCVFSYINVIPISSALRSQRNFISSLMTIKSKIICYLFFFSDYHIRDRFNSANQFKKSLKLCFPKIIKLSTYCTAFFWSAVFLV